MLTHAIAALETAFVRVAQRKTIAILVAGLLPLLARALLLPILPIPRPAIQDEFSYLLAADTFTHGRLANPTPPSPEHFETLQELIRPVYASKYPPVPGLVMAAGQKITGQPWAGVLLSMGILCAVLCWALQGWLPAVWALAGSLIAVLHIGIVSYWTESYWGGACTAIGGALLVGAIPRLVERPRISSALAYAAGLAVLANTRPFEGFIFAIVCSGWFVLRCPQWKRAIPPMAALLVPVALAMAYYNFRLTGHALELPYVAHERQYALIEPLLWDTHVRAEPVYSSAALRDFWQADLRQKQKDHRLLIPAHFWDLALVLRFFLGLPLAFCTILVARPLWRDPVARQALIAAGIAYIGPALDTRVWPHYAAAETVLVYLIAACALRAFRNAWDGIEGAYLMWGALLVFLIPTAFGLLAPSNRYLIGSENYLADAKHTRVEQRLGQLPGDHLVLVTYGPRHQPYEELVYNHADIDASKIVWARSLGPDKDADFIRRHPGRKIWSLYENGGVTLTCP
jgi:hypothetical protein